MNPWYGSLIFRTGNFVFQGMIAGREGEIPASKKRSENDQNRGIDGIAGIRIEWERVKRPLSESTVCLHSKRVFVHACVCARVRARDRLRPEIEVENKHTCECSKKSQGKNPRELSVLEKYVRAATRGDVHIWKKNLGKKNMFCLEYYFFNLWILFYVTSFQNRVLKLFLPSFNSLRCTRKIRKKSQCCFRTEKIPRVVNST